MKGYYLDKLLKHDFILILWSKIKGTKKLIILAQRYYINRLPADGGWELLNFPIGASVRIFGVAELLANISNMVSHAVAVAGGCVAGGGDKSMPQGGGGGNKNGGGGGRRGGPKSGGTNPGAGGGNGGPNRNRAAGGGGGGKTGEKRDTTEEVAGGKIVSRNKKTEIFQQICDE